MANSGSSAPTSGASAASAPRANNNNNNKVDDDNAATSGAQWTSGGNEGDVSEPSNAPSYEGIASGPFSRDVANVLLAPIDPVDVEIKPDGTLYLPEIKYRRRLNQAFGPGAWAMKPLGPATVSDNKVLFRTYQMFCYGRFVAEATGEQQIRSGMTFATAEESAKSNALMRCW